MAPINAGRCPTDEETKYYSKFYKPGMRVTPNINIRRPEGWAKWFLDVAERKEIGVITSVDTYMLYVKWPSAASPNSCGFLSVKLAGKDTYGTV